MKTRLFLTVAALCAMCLGAANLHAQQFAGPAPGPLMAPGYGGPVIPAGVIQANYAGLGASLIPASPAFAPPSQVMMAGATCDTGKGCGGCGKCDTCFASPTGGWRNGWTFYGEFLYLRSRDSEVAWAVEFDGPIAPGATPVQVSPVAVADMDYEPGFRAGFAYNINECSRISAEYTMWESSTNSNIVRNDITDVVRSMVAHPGSLTAASDFIQAAAQYDMSFDLVDVDVERLFWYDCNGQLGWVFGVRAGQLEQQFVANFAGLNTQQVSTDIDFTGVGIRFGLDGEVALGSQWMVYGNVMGNIVPGEFEATYNQGEGTDPSVVATGWKAGRIVTMWDLEVGLAWVSRCQNYRLNAGYMFSAWTNTVQTDEFIRGVQTNNFIDMDDTMTFDGLVARFEARY